jgi:hypothetical protein
MKLDCTFLLPVMGPAVDRQAQSYGCAVDDMERVFELEIMPGSTGKRTIQDFLEHRPEDFRRTPVYRVRHVDFETASISRWYMRSAFMSKPDSTSRRESFPASWAQKTVLSWRMAVKCVQ